MYKKGDLVKVRRDDKPWARATYNHYNSALMLHVVNHGTVPANDHIGHEDIMAFQPIDPDLVRAHGIEHAPEIVEALQKGFVALFGSSATPRCEVDAGEGIITLLGTDITIDPAAVETVSILGGVESAGWVVNVWHTVSGYPHSPDDVAEESRGEARTPQDAAKLALRVYCDLLIEQVFDVM